MDNYLYRLIGSFGTLVTTVFLIDISKHAWYTNVALGLIVLYSTVFLILDALRAISQAPKSFDRTSDSGKSKISKFLVDQLRSSGSVVIFSKDLTWVKPHSIAEQTLREKAKAGELLLYVEDEMPITKMLKIDGADIRAYARQGFEPTSRFTILDQRSNNPRVIIGMPAGAKHLIKEYGEADQEVVKLAKDFVSLLNQTAQVVK